MVLFNFRDIYATKFGLPLSARYKHDKAVVENFIKEVLHQHPGLDRLEAEGRALARLDYQEFQRLKSRTLISITKKHNWRVWVEVGVIAALLLAVIVLSAKMAHGQVDAVRVSASGVQQKQWAGGIAKFDFGSGLVVDCVSVFGTCKVTATGSGPGGGITTLNGLTTDPQTFAKVNDTNVTLTIGSVTSTHTFTLGWSGSLAVGRGGTGSAANTGSAGKVLMGNGSGAFIEGDPLVQGVVAAGASLAAIAPVYIGGVDGSGNSKGLVLDSSGRPTVNINGTQQVQSNSANIATETTVAGIKTGTDKIPAQGQALAAASIPVVLTAVQQTALTPPAAITNFANETGGNLAAIKTDVDKIPALGQALAAASVPVVLTAAQITTLTPVSTVTANQGGTWTVQPGNTANTTAWKVDGSAVTQPVSGTVTTSPPSNASTNIAQINGVTPLMGSGNTGTGSMRVTLATDQPNLATALNVNCTAGCTAGGSFADSSAFTFGTTAVGNMSAVVDDVATNAVAENSAGAVRMNGSRILYVDLSKTAANTNKLLVTPDSVALPANQSVNVSQINAVTPLMGNGITGTGSQRVTIASDNTAFSVNAAATLAAETTKVIGTVNVAAAQTIAVTQATPANLNATVIGSLADNGAAAATNRVGTLPAVTQTSYENGTASTQGRNAALSTGSDGLLWTANLPAIRPASYTASASFAGSSTTDIARLPGNASNTVLVTMVKFSCTQTTAGAVTVTVNKRSTAGSGGTAANITVVPDDSNYAAGVSVPQSYTGTGPTVGTLVGAMDNMKVGCEATSTAAPQDIYILNLRQKPIVLRGTAENLAINLGGAVTGGNVTVTFNWIETATILP